MMAAHKTATMKLVCVSCDCADDLSVVVVVLVVVVVDEDRVVEEVVLEESSSSELGSVWRLTGERVVDGGNPVRAVPPRVISPELQSSVTHGQTVALIVIVMRMG